MKNLIRLIFVFCLFASISSCRKEEDFNTDSSVKLAFSEDTIIFDTVFTTIGSTTGYLLVYNNEGSPVKISSIRLANGNSSSYRLNVDGSPGKYFTDIEIGANDSIWIFIEVTIDPNNQNTPFLITDSILFETNGNLQDVDLVAYGQNAHFIIPTDNFGPLQYSIIPCNNGIAVWDSTLPWVIYGYAVVDSACKLIIESGTKVHFYNNSGLWVYRYGLLNVNGTLEHPVTFQGTRLEQSYSDIPGQWDRIWINEGPGDSNEINYAIIKNGFIGLQPENLLLVPGTNPQKLILKNTIIKNMSGFGILSRDYTVEGYNLLIHDCGLYNAALTIGGSYEFNQCTFANYWNLGQRSTPAIYLNNYYNDGTSDIAVALTKADFKNCIVHGNIDNELQADIISGANGNYKFSYCLLKVDTSVHVSDLTHFDNVFTNEDPGFEDPAENNYELKDGSFAIDKGNAAFIIPFLTDKDIKEKIRPAPGSLLPDLGAYEKQ